MHCRQILYHLSHREAQEYWTGKATPSSADLPNPGIEPGSPALHPSISVFSNELALCIRWSKYWNFSFSISPSNEYSVNFL